MQIKLHKNTLRRFLHTLTSNDAEELIISIDEHGQIDWNFINKSPALHHEIY